MKFSSIRKLIISQRRIIELIQILAGTAIMGIAIGMFLLPNQLSSGGFTGIATIIFYLFKLPVGTVVLILNIPLFIWAFYKIGRTFFIKGVAGTVLLSYFIDFFEKFEPFTDDRFLACIYGGIIVGIGTAIILKANASTGGSELATHIIRQYNKNYKSSTVLVILDIIIVTVNMIFFREIEVGLYSAIVIYIMGKVIDIFFEGIYFTKIMYIVSDKHEEIAKEITKEIRRGVTGIEARGMYTNREKMMLFCVVSRNEVSEVKRIARKIDKKSFIIISNAREALGEGFKRE